MRIFVPRYKKKRMSKAAKAAMRIKMIREVHERQGYTEDYLGKLTFSHLRGIWNRLNPYDQRGLKKLDAISPPRIHY